MASGGINNKDKGGIVHRSSFRRFRCPPACHRGAFVIRGARSRNLGGHHGFCPCSRVVGTVPEPADATSLSLSLHWCLLPHLTGRQVSKYNFWHIWPDLLYTC